MKRSDAIGKTAITFNYTFFFFRLFVYNIVLGLFTSLILLMQITSKTDT